MIKLNNVSKTFYKGRENELKVLKQISMEIKSGEMVAIVGKSGAGKSTLLHVLGCIDSFDEGSYMWNEQDISHISESKKAKMRSEEIGIVIQDFALIEEYTVIENVKLPFWLVNKKPNGVLEALEKVGMKEFANKRVCELSGGQKQRTAIARAIVNHPKLLLADEPTGALDQKTGQEIVGLFQELNKEGTTVVIITHDREVASVCDRKFEIVDGNIVDIC